MCPVLTFIQSQSRQRGYPDSTHSNFLLQNTRAPLFVSGIITHSFIYAQGMPNKSGSIEPMAMSSSLNSIRITPRTPKTPRPAMDDEDDVELRLLDEEERLRSANGFQDEDSSVADSDTDPKKPISANDKRQMVLLCILCEGINSFILLYGS